MFVFCDGDNGLLFPLFHWGWRLLARIRPASKVTIFVAKKLSSLSEPNE